MISDDDSDSRSLSGSTVFTIFIVLVPMGTCTGPCLSTGCQKQMSSNPTGDRSVDGLIDAGAGIFDVVTGAMIGSGAGFLLAVVLCIALSNRERRRQ